MQYIGQCEYCGADCYWDEDREKFISHFHALGCLCHVKGDEDDESTETGWKHDDLLKLRDDI